MFDDTIQYILCNTILFNNCILYIIQTFFYKIIISLNK